MKKLISLFLVLLTILSMTVVAGCGEDKTSTDTNTDATTTPAADEEVFSAEHLVGTWTCGYDVAAKIVDPIKADADLGKYVPDTKHQLTLLVTAEFTKEGKFTMKTSDSAVNTVSNFLENLLTEIYTPYIADVAVAQEKTEAEILAEIGVTSISELVDASISDFDFSGITLDIDENYTADDSKIYVSEDKTTYYTYEYKDVIDTLVLTGTQDPEASASFPMTFKKQA